GTVTFGASNQLNTTASFSAGGTYILRLTASDSVLSSTADVTITVNSATNTAPVVTILGAPASVTLPSGANLSGFASDDGLPNLTLLITWSMVSGPGTVTFDNPEALGTLATFSTPGTYVVRLTATDTALSSTADRTITVNPAIPPPVDHGFSVMS